MRLSGICLVSPNVRRLRDFYADVLQVEAEGENVFVLFSVERTRKARKRR